MDQEKRTKIWERLRIGGATSIVVSEAGKEFATELLAELHDNLNQESIVPVLVCCSSYHSSDEFWKGLSGEVLALLKPKLSMDSLSAVENNVKRIANNTQSFMLKRNLDKILDQAKTKDGISVLLVLFEFDSMFVFMSEPGMMMVRNIGSKLTLLTVSKRPLDDLGVEYYGQRYFCNQFLTFIL